jgi:hypothetical protein
MYNWWHNVEGETLTQSLGSVAMATDIAGMKRGWSFFGMAEGHFEQMMTRHNKLMKGPSK